MIALREQLISLEGAIILKLCIAFFLGALIGYERERRGKQAGMRTIILVITTAVLFTHISLDSRFDIQPAIIPAQIVFGISFIGAGLIFRTPDGQIDNLTTAATIWFVAALGMGIGVGKGLLAVIATLFYFIIIMIPNIVRRIPPLSK